MQVTESHGRRVMLTVAAGALVVLMGLQRVYAGAHWPSDVIGACLWGSLLLFVLVQFYLKIESSLPESRRRRSTQPALARRPDSRAA
jgi:membrane-associated phospholipid phosphatase